MTRRLFAWLDPDRAELAPAFAALAAGEHETALRVYRDLFVSRRWPRHDDIATPQLTNVLNPATDSDALLRDNLLCVKMPGLEEPLCCDFTPGRIEWDRNPPSPAPPDGLRGMYVWLSPFTPALRAKWSGSDGMSYWRKWEQIMDDFCLRHSRTRFAGYAFGFSQMVRARGILQCLKNEGRERTDPKVFGRCMLSAIEDHIPGVVWHMRFGPGNQAIDAAHTAIKIAGLLPELTVSDRLHREGVAAMAEYPSRSSQFDGPDVENALNYMGAFPSWAGLTLESTEAPEELMDAIGLPLRYRLRFLAQNLIPTGQYFRGPSADMRQVSTQYWPQWERSLAALIGDDPEVTSILSTVRGAGDPTTIPFLNRAFPYSGYYYIREGWRPRDQQVLFRASRAVPYRQQEDGNTVVLNGEGQELLCDSGYPINEGPLGLYMHSSNSRNTVSVDGYGQVKEDGPPSLDPLPYSKPIAARWLSSPSFDYTEGSYTSGYGTYPQAHRLVRHHLTGALDFPAGDYQEQRFTDVTHQRQILFIREARLWVVIDRLHASRAHVFAQHWHLPAPIAVSGENAKFFASLPKQFANTGLPGFVPADVRCDTAAKTVTARNPQGCGFRMFHAGMPSLEYRSWFGEEDETQLWPPSRFHGWAVRWDAGKRDGRDAYRPAVEVAARWTADKPHLVMTVICADGPGKLKALDVTDASSGDVVGMKLACDDGRAVHVRASLRPQPLATPLATVHADTLALLRDGEATGAVGFALGTLPNADGACQDGGFVLQNGVPSVAHRTRFPVSPPRIVPASPWFDGEGLVRLETPDSHADDTVIRFTLDGSEPTWQSLIYTGQIPIRSSTRVTAATFRKGDTSPAIDDRFIDCSPAVTRRYLEPVAIPPSKTPADDTSMRSPQPWTCDLYEGDPAQPSIAWSAQMDWMPVEMWSGTTAPGCKIAQLFDLPAEAAGKERYLIVYRREIQILERGLYCFYPTPSREHGTAKHCCVAIRLNGSDLSSSWDGTGAAAAILHPGFYRVEVLLRVSDRKAFEAGGQKPCLEWSAPGVERRAFR